MQEAVKKDHVCASYKENKRGNDKFISSDVIVMDIDNDHTDDPSEYITESKMDELFPDINYCLVPSRHHMLEKGSHPAAPRYHVMFPVEAITDATQYAKVKELLYKNYPFFDGNALDAARFLYGSEVGEVIWHEGWMNITDELEDGDLTTGEPDDEEFDAPTHSGPAVRRRYGRVWKRIRDSYVKTHPFCELCYEKGVIVPVEEVHHKVPLAEGGTHERSNLISLCKRFIDQT